MIHAEVIGNPIAQSKSPLIHKGWLAALGLEGDYRATRVQPEELGDFLRRRRGDPYWRGCNVTIPHKQAVMPFLDRIDPGAAAIGAVNTVIAGPDGLTGRNTDIDGVRAAIGTTDVAGRKAALIGAGGGARAAIRYFLDSGAATVAIVVRDPIKAAPLRQEGPGTRVELWPIDRCNAALEGAAVIVNASPMGMDGAAPMSPALLAAVAAHAPGTAVFDMVYKPLETAFLAAARTNGGIAIDGLTMLVGQARAAFRAFFGQEPPDDDAWLRDLLIT